MVLCWAACFTARLLDKEYTNCIKMADPEFDYGKLGVVRELSGEVVEEFMAQASSKVEESRKKAWMASFHSFRHARGKPT